MNQRIKDIADAAARLFLQQGYARTQISHIAKAAGCLFIEKNQFDFQVLARPYIAYRKQFPDTMMRYISAFIEQGTVRPLEHLELSTTLIIEILSWWAMDIRYTSFETKNLSMDLAKQVCMDNIVAAYKR